MKPRASITTVLLALVVPAAAAVLCLGRVPAAQVRTIHCRTIKVHGKSIDGFPAAVNIDYVRKIQTHDVPRMLDGTPRCTVAHGLGRQVGGPS